MATSHTASVDLAPSGIMNHRGDGHLPLADRIAWLLRSNRLLDPHQRWTRAKSFAAAFRGGSWSSPTTESRISRWETAAVRPTHQAVVRYEELLDLPSGTLTAVIDTLHRYAAPPGHGPPALTRRLPAPAEAAGRIDELLDRALSTALMTGPQWDELSVLISAQPNLIISPRSARDALADRLLHEMIVAHGLQWQQRFEAFNRLIAHPSCQQAAVAACAGHGNDPKNQVFIETLSALDGTAHPDASRHVLAQLHRPTNDRAFLGALLACARKIRFGHFTAEQLTDLTTLIVDLVLEPAHHTEARPLAAALLRHAPNLHRPGVQAALRRAAADDRTVGEVVATGQLAAPQTARVVVTRIVNAATAALPYEMTNDVFPVLVRELLFHPLFDIRLYTAMLIAATPYREPLARALADELAAIRAPDRVDLNSCIISALRTFGTGEQRPLIERISIGTGLPGPLVVLATHAIGHLGGQSDDRYWATAVDHHNRLWRRHRDPLHESALRGLVYGLGIARREALLGRLRLDPAAPEPARTAADWWLGLPRHVTASAVH
ncbi:hypothetical protein [Polymorphospora rubra]|uniref:Uncharacterized protein n=1 Tax=Polymorphospora rubra TaxID=338584 RepID=A0A810MRG5_9ACTN|nr:hypothetical protein [Polymorphospora rubra]BCJ63050.1 hypothetical protein Prubr_00710 [Polymorphospora rubra]